ncbi:MAG: 16S rRNA (cytidine(1402)-2'-O)-methyltransferase [Culicoidibacterales bacterium]
MKRYLSYKEENVLYLVPTPIGNLDDMTVRSLKRLQESDIILAEDTRNTKKLCNHFGIHAQLISLHEHNENDRIDMVEELLREGKQVSLVSDAGMPAISDPGARLVRGLRERDLHSLALPGASAFVSAYAASGIGQTAFYFHGFLESKGSKRTQELQMLSQFTCPVVIYESVHRIEQLCRDVNSVFGSQTKMIVAREISKMYEEYIFGTPDEIRDVANTLKGEFVVIIHPEKKIEAYPDDIVEHYLLAQKQHATLSEKELIKHVAKIRGVHKNDVYQIVVKMKGE